MPSSRSIRLLVLTLLLSAAASAQTFITVAVAPAAVTWNLTPGNATNVGTPDIVVNTSWNLSPGSGTTLSIYAYFASASAALNPSALCTGCPNIPSSAFEIGINGGVYTPVTGTGPFGGAGASLQLASIPIRGFNKTSSESDTLQFNINLSTLPNLAADTYTGVLNIQAQSIP